MAILIEAFVVMFVLWTFTALLLCILGYILAVIIDETKTFGYSSLLIKLTKRK